MHDDDRIAALEQLLGHTFRDRDLLLRALTHRSYLNEHPQDVARGHNERLEFLGDAVLSLIASERLWAADTGASEGTLSRRRAAFVSEAALSAAARRQGIGAWLRMGRGQAREGGAELPSLLADTVEALLAAVYLDAGLDAARRAVSALLGEVPHELEAGPVDPKTQLQERLQRALGQSPCYRLARDGGPDHAPHYVATVHLGERSLGRGEGSNKKVATRAAALDALGRIEAMAPDALAAAFADLRS